MNKETVYYMDGRFERIDKREARKLFDAGETILLVPSNMSFYDNIRWSCAYTINKADVDEFGNFDTLINSYMYYNCNNETGKYIKFYRGI